MAVEEDVFTTSSYSITSLTGTAVAIKLSGSWITKQINGSFGPGVFIVDKTSGDVINATVSYASMSGTTTATITGEGLSPETEYAIPECAGFIFYDNSRLDIPTRIEFTTASVTPTDDESYLNKRGLAHFWENIDTLKQDKLTAGTNITISANNTISASQPTVGNATLTIQKNGTNVQTFTANATSNKTANITVPTKTSDLTNDSNFVADASYVHTDNNYTTTEKNKLAGIAAGAEVNVQANWTQTTTTADDYIKNKPTLATVATSGSYDDLSNKPTIPAAQVQSNWTQTTTTAADYIKNKPTLATVATSGSYNDLSSKPTIPAAQVNSDWSANSGVAQILNKPTLATVATSGSYNDLSNKPTIPTVNNATLTIQKNGSTVKTFTANASSNVTADITVPTALSDLSGTVSSSQIAGSAVTTAKIADSAVTSAKVDWSTLDGSETGWKYLGQVKLTSAGASLTFNLPAQYDNYKIVAAGEMATGSNATCQLQLLRNGAAIASAWGVLDINGSSVVAGTRTAADDQFSMASCNQYDTINMEMTSFKTASTQWRKFQGYQARMGSAYVTRQYNGRFNSSTEPNQVRIWTSATFGAGAVIKVWASNNT